MNNFGRSLAGLATCAALLSGWTAVAAPPPAATSLDKCQDTVRNEGKKFVENTIAAVGICLKGVAGDVIKKNVAISASTSAKCVAQFRKIYDSRGAGKSLEEKLRAKVDAKCVPGNPNVTHNINDITGNAGGSAGVQPINTNNIQTWCKHFGGTGSIATVADWENCMEVSSVASLIGSFNCEAAAAIATQYPRAAEWLAALTTPLINMNAVVPPATDLNKTSDAVTGATNFLALIDPDGDLIPNPRCGGEGVVCKQACCYVENLAAPPDTECYEYTGPPAQVNAFLFNCDGGAGPPGVPGSLPVGSLVNTGVVGPCIAGPTFAFPCIPGPPPGANMYVIPQDSSCP
jgi:hypothetical protein